jgi:DNA-binding Xre family transcriptional regulator
MGRQANRILSARASVFRDLSSLTQAVGISSAKKFFSIMKNNQAKKVATKILKS